MKIYINDNYATMSVDIWITDEHHNKRFIAQPVNFIMQEYNPNLSIEHAPTLRLTREVAFLFLQAMAEALDSRGIKTENDHKLMGILEAKKEHLEDMRKLVFKEAK